MRPPIGMPSMSKRSKRVLITLAVLVVLAVLWFQFVGIFVNWEWFGEVDYRQVWTTEVLSRVVLFVIGAIGGGGVVFLSLLLAFRSRPVFVPSGEVDPLSPYRTIVSSRPKTFVLSISILVGLICGFSAQGNWQTVQLWLHAQSFGQTDPQFGHDVGFYVFTLPALQMIMGWLFAVVALAFFAVLVTQYLYGGLRFSGPGRRITSQAALQLSLLVGAFVLVKAIQYWFDRYALLFSNRGGSFTGASYTDVNAVLPAKIILMVIAAICAVGFFVGAFLRSVKLPAVALALLVLSSVLIGGVWPLVLQQVVVSPNGISKEPPYIQRNLDATRTAYDIGSDTVTYKDYSGQLSVPASQVVDDTGTVPNARLLDPNVLSPTFTQQQQLRNWYGFPDQLAVDRYTINGKTQDYVVAARELNEAGLSGDQTNWINKHMVYTHGDGFVAAPANTVVNGGYPDYTISDISGQGDIKVDQTRIYYGQLTTDYSIVGVDNGSQPREKDTNDQPYAYTGAGGVHIGNLFQRLVFATEYSDANFLFSSEINGNSKILYNRDPRTRVEKVAPFLTTDTAPYPAVVDKRLVWIVDGYTTAQNYPYAQNVSLGNATSNSLDAQGAAGQVNTQVSYIRNSVKATVDAYDGTVTLYSVDDSKLDPVLKAWEGVFPDLIKPTSAISTDLRAHFKYPQDLFEVQRSLLINYNVQKPVDFFNSSGFWKVPGDPTSPSDSTLKQPPYYLQVKLPGDTQSHFNLTSVLTGFSRDFMAAYMSASSDPETYGKITVLTLPTATQTPGPAQVQTLFRTTSQISSLVTLSTNQSGGSRVIFGNLLTLPVDSGLLYVEPFYIQGQASSSSYPQLSKVLVWYDGKVGVGDSLTLALQNAAPVATPATGGTGGSTSATTPPSGSVSVTSPTTPGTPAVLPSNVNQAVQQMNTANQALVAAKASGDLAQIGAASQKLQDAVNNYLKIAGTGTSAPAATTAVTSSGG
ncbi:uncharacterized membrane protein (UPF0182 family) [Nakamurella sp. UYEF19]|uniref:UPF0182 family membrane protein n=1 Tax=Nakamurella sp. UYEF19 TaxID=1756392 RepID=UPI00339588E4